MRMTVSLILATIALSAPSVHAQQPAAPKAGAIISSSPGKVAAVAAVEVTATVTAIDKGTRTVTLKGPKGRVIDVAAGDEIRNFDQIRVGDSVVVQYAEALSLELKKSRATPGATISGSAVRADPGSRPAGAGARELTVLADVVAVDPKKGIISLKGPGGNVFDLKVENPDHFKVVKKGDQVEAVYKEAIALAVTPAPKSGGKK